MEKEELHNLDFKLSRVWRRSMKAVADYIQQDILNHGLTLDTFIILELLYNMGPQSVQKISEKFSIPSGSITYVVDKLEKKELVFRQASPTDRRVSNVVLTERGRTMFDDIFPKHADVISQTFSFINDDEKRLLIDFLKKIGLGAEQLKSTHVEKGGEQNG
jgi:MarR family 2-MHQ and catechol resistance regulon transcriptional repressor